MATGEMTGRACHTHSETVRATQHSLLLCQAGAAAVEGTLTQTRGARTRG